MIERFQGASGRALLIKALEEQILVSGNSEVAARIATSGVLSELDENSVLIQQDASDNTLHFILAGRLSVQINGREVAVRGAGEHVGEMAVIDPSARRSATVLSLERSVVLTVEEASFSAIADDFPHIWRRVALELGNRLRQRSRFFLPPNPRPVMFIGSSSEALPVARALQVGLRDDDMLVRVWTDRVFGASRFPIEDLEVQLQTSDFSVLVLGPDDRVVSRGEEFDGPRDNTVLELGLFLGALGRSRTFLLCPNGVEVKIPTDLLGITTLKYQPVPEEDLADAVEPACQELREIIRDRGVR